MAKTAINRFRGDTKPITVHVTKNGADLDITGCSFILTTNSQQNPEDTSNQVFSIAGVITDGEGGLVTFTPTTDDADNVGRFYFDVQMTDGSGAKDTILKGDYSVRQDISKG